MNLDRLGQVQGIGPKEAKLLTRTRLKAGNGGDRDNVRA